MLIYSSIQVLHTFAFLVKSTTILFGQDRPEGPCYYDTTLVLCFCLLFSYVNGIIFQSAIITVRAGE
jgi:hypothetical protein